MERNQRAALLALVFGAVALFSGLRGYAVAFVGTLLGLLTVTLAYFWNRLIFKGLTLERTLNRRHAEFDSVVTMEVEMTNKKLLPLLGVKLENPVTPGLNFANAQNVLTNKNGPDTFFDHFNLGCFERRRRSYEVRSLQRGRFEMGKGILNYTDPFGLFENRQEEVLEPVQLIVFPRVIPIQGQAALDTFLFGSRPKEGWILTDPLNVVGTRPYQITDSTKSINWKATARHGYIQVNEERPSFDQQVYVFLDQPPEVKWWAEAISNKLEIGIMTAASLIDSYTQLGYEIEFASNLVSRVRGLGTRRARGDARLSQRTQLLMNLALLHNFSAEPSTVLLNRLQRKVRSGSTVVVITTAPGQLNSTFVRLIGQLMTKARVGLLRVGAEGCPSTPGLKEWQIEGGRNWREMEALELF